MRTGRRPPTSGRSRSPGGGGIDPSGRAGHHRQPGHRVRRPVGGRHSAAVRLGSRRHDGHVPAADPGRRARAAHRGRPADEFWPQWSPDGTEIAFHSFVDGAPSPLRHVLRRRPPAAGDRRVRGGPRPHLVGRWQVALLPARLQHAFGRSSDHLTVGGRALGTAAHHLSRQRLSHLVVSRWPSRRLQRRRRRLSGRVIRRLGTGPGVAR